MGNAWWAFTGIMIGGSLLTFAGVFGLLWWEKQSRIKRIAHIEAQRIDQEWDHIWTGGVQ